MRRLSPRTGPPLHLPMLKAPARTAAVVDVPRHVAWKGTWTESQVQWETGDTHLFAVQVKPPAKGHKVVGALAFGDLELGSVDELPVLLQKEGLAWKEGRS